MSATVETQALYVGWLRRGDSGSWRRVLAGASASEVLDRLVGLARNSAGDCALTVLPAGVHPDQQASVEITRTRRRGTMFTVLPQRPVVLD